MFNYNNWIQCCELLIN